MKLGPAQILRMEFNEDYVTKMKNRTVMGFYRYGPSAKNVKTVDMIATIKKRIEKYEDTGNTDWLIDVGNFAMFEFTYPQHPDAHFKATDSDDSPGVEGIPFTQIGKPNREGS